MRISEKLILEAELAFSSAWQHIALVVSGADD